MENMKENKILELLYELLVMRLKKKDKEKNNE